MGWSAGLMIWGVLLTVVGVIVAGLWLFVDRSTRDPWPDTVTLSVGTSVRYRSSERIGTIEEVAGSRYRVRFDDYEAWLAASELTAERPEQ